MSRNELRDSASPYLLQHAQNPVHWRLWGAAALAEAQANDKPILLSIGYAACHWCHVMAHESFEDPETAALMNELFVNIKVDREERPDIDHLYMSALHMLGEQGGWPLTMFLTPKGEAFWGGTYFPPEPRYGRPSFREILRSIARIYRIQGQAVAENAAAIRRRLSAAPSDHIEPLTLDFADSLARLLNDAIDPLNGGLRGSPKFPNPSILENLWRSADRLGNESMRASVALTLERMCRGGIFDHLGGGFARYSVDERWLVPHFEKMLYDNAQVLDLLAGAWIKTNNDIFRQAALKTVGWLEREMRAPSGAFFASLDADSEGVEGKFYVWSYSEIIDALGPDAGPAFAKAYDISPMGNWRDEHSGLAVNILNRLHESSDESDWSLARSILFSRREKRIAPSLDDKILADWNGLAIAALARASLAFNMPAWRDLASVAYRFVYDSMMGPHLEAPVHAMRNDVASAPAMALDYAAMASAALAMAEVFTDSTAFINDAKIWLERLWRDHRNDHGLLTMPSRAAEDVLLRLAPTQDDAIPNAHGLAAQAMIRLHVWTGDMLWLNRADALIAAATPAIRSSPANHCGLLNAFESRMRMIDVVVIAPRDHELAHIARANMGLNCIVRIVNDSKELPSEHPLADLGNIGTPTAFVCGSDRCSPPATTANDLVARIAEFHRTQS